MALFREQADVSVRPAVAEDGRDIARIQLEAWRTTHAELLGPDVLDQVDGEAVRARWDRAVTSPPSGSHRVLVACEGARVVGFAASAPDTEPDGTERGVEVLALEVDPGHQRGGHGSRLLTACVDLAREDGAQHLQTWVLDGDEARSRFLASAGLGPDGTARSLGISSDASGLTRTVGEKRWVATI